MTHPRQLLGIARADFLERVRRHAFLVTLGFTLYAGYLFLPPNHSVYATVRFDDYRGVYNSAWVGTVTAMMTAVFLGFAGFYLVKNAVEHDRRSGVGAILAGTPITKFAYLMGKTLSNFAVLATMVALLPLAAAVMQLVRGEDPRLDVFELLVPFAVLTLPAMAAVAATAVLFESIPILRGGLGNVAYFFLWSFTLASSMSRRESLGLDFAGISHVLPTMARACHRAFSDYDLASGRMALGFNFRAEGVWDLRTFAWNGMEWTGQMLAGRLAWFGIALVLVAMASMVFDRFDEAPAAKKERSGRKAREAMEATSDGALEPGSFVVGGAPSVVRLGRLERPLSFSLSRLVAAELAVMRKDLTRPWLLVAGALVVTSCFVPLDGARHFVLPALWIWPLLHWSPLGNREIRHDTAAMLFSTPRPLLRPLIAQWLAGSILALALALGVAARLIAVGDFADLMTLLAGALFVPALAVALGAWSGSGKLFEVLYLLLWYVGPVNRVAAFDYTGGSATTAPSAWTWLASTAVLLILALTARARRIVT